MKFVNVLAATFLISLHVANAQTGHPTKTQEAKAAFTDEDLKKYAITMDSVNGMKETLQSIIAEMVQQNQLMKVPR